MEYITSLLNMLHFGLVLRMTYDTLYKRHLYLPLFKGLSRNVNVLSALDSIMCTSAVMVKTRLTLSAKRVPQEVR